jgi:peptide/nickel transport system permease protein
MSVNDGSMRKASIIGLLARGFVRFVRRNPLGGPGALVLSIVALAAAFPDALASSGALDQDIPNRLQPPGPDFLFGTDGSGRDMFSRVVHGARSSLYVGVMAVVIATVVGIGLGVTSAAVGGTPDFVLQRLVDAMLGVPFMVLAVVVVVSLGPSSNSVIGALAIAYTPQVARLTRIIALTVMVEPYVLAARLQGAGTVRVMVRHLLPNTYTPVLAHATGLFGSALVAESVLSFLGLGIPPPDPSWGRMIQEGSRSYLEVAPWLTVVPGLVLTVTVLAFLFVSDGVRELLDPFESSNSG